MCNKSICRFYLMPPSRGGMRCDFHVGEFTQQSKDTFILEHGGII